MSSACWRRLLFGADALSHIAYATFYLLLYDVGVSGEISAVYTAARTARSSVFPCPRRSITMNCSSCVAEDGGRIRLHRLSCPIIFARALKLRWFAPPRYPQPALGVSAYQYDFAFATTKPQAGPRSGDTIETPRLSSFGT